MVEGALVKRSSSVAFMGVTVGGDDVFMRMEGFTELTKTKNAKTYSRQYVDEEFEQEDVTGYKPEISYAFDRHKPNKVQQPLVDIHNDEKTGSDTLVDIVEVDFSVDSVEGAYPAIKRTWATIPDSEGDSMDAMTYSGKFSTKSAIIKGTAVYDKDARTIEFTEA